MPADKDGGISSFCIYHPISDEPAGLKIGHARIWGGQRDPLGSCKIQKLTLMYGCWCSMTVVRRVPTFKPLIMGSSGSEQPDNPITRQQAERRSTGGPGQTKRVPMYDLLVKATKDHALC